MCSTKDDIEDLMAPHDCKNLTSYPTFSHQRGPTINSICRKCGEPAMELRRQDPLCRSCFMVYCDHKFRSTIGKSKRLKPGDKVLLAYSGGLCSSAMLFMVKKTLEDACNKRLCFTPALLHINEFFVTHTVSDEQKELEELYHKMKESKYPVYLSSLEMALCDSDETDFYWNTCPTEQNFGNKELRQALVHFLNDTRSLSAKEDYLRFLRIHLITNIAKHAGFACVFFGASCNNLSIQLLSDIALGRGSQISADTSFYDRRYKVPICRPLREFLLQELESYAQENSVSYKVYPTYSTFITASNAKLNSIQLLTEKFVSDLQKGFPSTVHTIFRTAGKVAPSSSERSVKEICTLCHSKLDNVNPVRCSAIESLSISSKLSQPLQQNCTKNVSCSPLEINGLHFLCHGCRITVTEMGLSKKLHTQPFMKLKKPASIDNTTEESKSS